MIDGGVFWAAFLGVCVAGFARVGIDLLIMAWKRKKQVDLAEEQAMAAVLRQRAKENRRASKFTAPGGFRGS